MNKKLFLFAFMVLLSFTLMGCDLFNSEDTTTVTTTTTISEVDIHDLDAWLSSDLAIDLNGDRRINELDFELYKLQNIYDYWKQSDYAYDNNLDRLINEEDFEIYRLQNNYEYWKSSTEAFDFNEDNIINQTDYDIYLNYDLWRYSTLAEDLNQDHIINLADYELYLEFAEFVGTYTFTNYVYVGEETYAFILDDGYLFLKDFGQYLSRIILTVSGDGTTSVTIPTDVQAVFGSMYGKMVEGTENLTITRISPYIVGIDTFVVVDDVEVQVTIYLTETNNGYHATYVMGMFEGNPTISFDIIKN